MMRDKINKLTETADKKNKTAIIYGKMPPKARKAQA